MAIQNFSEPAYERGTPSHDICSSCHFHFGKTDDDEGYTHEQWRKKWIKEGMVWDKGSSKSPENWDPKKQLLNIGIKV